MRELYPKPTYLRSLAILTLLCETARTQPPMQQS